MSTSEKLIKARLGTLALAQPVKRDPLRVSSAMKQCAERFPFALFVRTAKRKVAFQASALAASKSPTHSSFGNWTG
jgi:hypothetical protein